MIFIRFRLVNLIYLWLCTWVRGVRKDILRGFWEMLVMWGGDFMFFMYNEDFFVFYLKGVKWMIFGYF